MTPEERQELCALYVLGVLDPEDMVAFDARLQTGDQELVREVAAVRAMVDLLPHALPPVPPNPAVRSHLMARVQETVSEPKVAYAGSPWRTALHWLRPSWRWLPTTAAVAVALVLAWQMSAFRQRVASLETELQQLGEVADQHERLVSLLSLPNVQIVMLSGTEHAARASARLLWDTTRGEWTVIMHELPPTPPGKVYQLWLLTPEQPVPAQTFRPDPHGRGIIHTKLPSDALTLAGAAVSVEPEGGVAQPTGDIVLLGKF